MKIEYYHASKYGNGALVAEEFKRLMITKGVTVNVHHIRDARPKELPPADLYIFSSPGRFGKPIRGMRRFLKKVKLPSGSQYAVLTTQHAPQIPMMNEELQAKGLKKVAESKILVTDIKGPLEEDWQKKVEEFAAQIPIRP
jgi:flavorubredoxin